MRERILGFIASWLMRFLNWTCRYRLYFQDESDRDFFIQAMSSSKPSLERAYILSFFHQDELSLIPYFQNVAMGVLVSISKDGEIMTQTASRLGYYPVRGSSSKKAVAGLIAAIKKVKEGYKFAMAVDGPKGPIYKVKDGVIAISKKSELKILPVRAYPHKYKMFEKAWNKAKLPKFFTRIDLIFGKFDFYDRESLENTMIAIEHNTDNLTPLS
jgi:lysophospholipid acyltransferase (LPLAT)-like uncharacterized protein